MPDAQAQIPDPLIDELPALLSVRRVTTPTVGGLFLILIGQHLLEGSALMVEFDHAGCGEGVIWQGGQKEFIDLVAHYLADRDFLRGWGLVVAQDQHPGGQGGAGNRRLPGRQVPHIKERSGSTRFRVRYPGRRGRLEAGLDVGMAQQTIVLAPPDEAQSGLLDVGQHAHRAIQSIQPQHALSGWQRMGIEIGADDAHGFPQFSDIVAIACARKGAQPFLGVCLEDGGAGADNLSPLASAISGRGDGGQATAGWREGGGLGEGALASTLAGAIDIKEQPALPLLIPQATNGVAGQSVVTDVLLYEVAQSGEAGGINGVEEAAEGGTMGQVLSLDEGQKQIGKGGQVGKEGLEGGFTTEGIRD
jgi:hypothetical protein